MVRGAHDADKKFRHRIDVINSIKGFAVPFDVIPRGHRFNICERRLSEMDNWNRYVQVLTTLPL